ncbi:diacylglycerol kinase family lipid kinase [Flavobacteriales bacterium]|nr:diacylglycerol kinase family lipid kinase [Flavobacteriales bacterium]
MKIKFIVNPISGKGKQKDIENTIRENLDSKRYEYTVQYTKKKEHAKELSKQAITNGYEAIIAVGGDGTVNEIASECIGKDTILGIIPAGSGNGFAYHIGMKKNIKKSILQLNNAKVKIVDSCTVNSIPFVNVSGIGFDAHIANLFQNLEKRGFWNYTKLIYKEINYKAKEYTINYNGKSRKIKAVMISFANATQYGNNFRISPRSELDDGIIDFVIVKDMPKRMIPQFLIKIANGKIENSKFVEIIQAKEMEIFSDEEIIHLDGEPKTISKSVVVKNNPKTLKILVPNG